ncbi:MAG TPA: uroporphyrinogen-III synthase [Sediminibacterium sp.]
MPDKRIQILSTRPITGAQLDNARKKGVDITVQSFIETTALQEIAVQQEIEWVSVQETVVVFTSMNAVVAVTDMLDGHVPSWRIYCMGYATQKLVAEYFGETSIAGTGASALELAETIIEEEEPDELIFFCGNIRRDELPVKLSRQGITVHEICVYETLATPHKMEKTFDGILFFSPSAAESFFSNNTIPPETVLFAIGQTTRDTLARFTRNKIVVSKEPGKDEMVGQAVKYFRETGIVSGE